MSGASKIILVAALVLIVGAVGILFVNRNSISFAFFHHPVDLASTTSTNTYTGAARPKFSVSNQISPIPAAGQPLSISLTAKSDIKAVGFVEVWISAPNGKEIYKSPADTPTDFAAGVPASFNFSYVLPASPSSGTYSISERITSFSQKTDYYVNENFDKFRLQ